MQKATKTMEYDATQKSDEGQPKDEKQGIPGHATNGELRFYGARGLIMNPLAMCEKLDKMFGSGAEAIVHYMLFESGRDTFDVMTRNNTNKSQGEMLKALVDLQPYTGWGYASLSILHTDPPMVGIVIKNPPVKTLKGSQKLIIGSFWAGVLSRYFNRQLTSKNMGYDAEKDEFNCRVTV
ncbi:MAG TPA: hypothetical protein VJ249_05835 [Candidatus Bathyarchaeia archaeon]|nr:hypothetical protein [Candidatus Bathyarchaeia archaeon]